MALKMETIATKTTGPAQSFLMMTAHVKSGDQKKDEPAKRSQGAEVAAIIAMHNQGRTPEGKQIQAMPVIFACDFNNKPGGIAHNSFFGELREGNKSGIKKDLSESVTSAYADVLETWRCPAET